MDEIFTCTVRSDSLLTVQEQRAMRKACRANLDTRRDRSNGRTNDPLVTGQIGQTDPMDTGVRDASHSTHPDTSGCVWRGVHERGRHPVAYFFATLWVTTVDHRTSIVHLIFHLHRVLRS